MNRYFKLALFGWVLLMIGVTLASVGVGAMSRFIAVTGLILAFYGVVKGIKKYIGR